MRTFSLNPAAYKNFRTLWKSARWAIILTWLTDKKLLLGVITGHVIQSLTPVGMALTARGLVNAVVSIVNTDMQQSNILLFWVVCGLTLAILEATSSFAVAFYKSRLKDELNLRITSDILTHAATLDLLYFEDPHFQNMMQRIRENTAANFSEFVSNTLTIIRNCIQSASLIGLLIVIEPFIVILLLPVAIVYLVFQWRLAKTHYQVWHSRSVKQRWANYFVAQFTDHALVPEVKLLGLAALFKQKFRALMREFRDQDRKLYLRSFCINIIFAVLSATAVYMALARVAFRVIEKGLTVGDVAIFGSAATRLRRIIEQTIDAITGTLEQTLYISNLIDFFQITPQISPNIDLTLPASRAEIELNNVTFSYPGSDQPVLQDISLHIQPGETVALVGENGAGKTTLVKLIARLYNPEHGSVLFDGHDVRRLSLEYLYSQISFIFQNFNRYEATVSENIAYGDWQKILQTPERIAQIARLSGIHDMIVTMPQGYDTMLGRMFGEYTLSGGQWQQIALARAFVRDTATLLILDEPTSHLDPRSEYNLFCRFKELARGRTTILISHRFSTVSMADRIFVIDRGQIIEQGSHLELLAKKGLYANLYTLHQLQMSNSDENTEKL